MLKRFANDKISDLKSRYQKIGAASSGIIVEVQKYYTDTDDRIIASLEREALEECEMYAREHDYDMHSQDYLDLRKEYTYNMLLLSELKLLLRENLEAILEEVASNKDLTLRLLCETNALHEMIRNLTFANAYCGTFVDESELVMMDLKEAK